MKSTFEKKENEVVFKCSLDKAEWEKELEAAYNRTKKKYKVHGFRPGHAPRRIIEMYYGQGVFFDAAVDACIQRAFEEQMAAHPELHTFGSPEVSFEQPEGDDAFAFSMKVTLYPEVKLGSYKGIKLPKVEYNVSDADVQERIDADLKHASRLVQVERPAESGDTVNIDYVGTVDGVEFDGGKADGYDLKLGSNTFIPGFEDQLVGVKAGEERDVNVSFPEEYHAEELKGKAAVFHVAVHSVQFEELPEFNDEFVKEHTKYETVDEYKKGLRADLESAAAQRERNEKIDLAMNAITDNAECNVPEKIISAEVDRMLHEMEHQLSMYGISAEDYLKYNNSSLEQFRSERHDVAARNVKMRQVLRAIVEAENIDATDEEAEAKLASNEQLRRECEAEAKEHGGSPEEFVKNDIITDKFFDFIIANNEYVLEPEAAEGNAEQPTTDKPTEKPEKPAKKPGKSKKTDKKPDDAKPE